MKNNVFYGLFACFLTSLLSNCSSDSNESIIIGKWNFKSVIEKSNSFDYKQNSSCNRDYIEFVSYTQGKLGTYFGTPKSDCVENIDLFSFNKKNNEIKLNTNIGSDSDFIIEKLNVSTLHLKTDSDRIYVFERVFNTKR